MSKKTEMFSKDDALVLLSGLLRNPKLDTDLFVKVMNLYSKIAGWDKEIDPKPSEPTLDELVKEVEKKRKQHA